MPKFRRPNVLMAEHSPSEEWGDETYVQWGSGGLVISRGHEPRITAFFEAFPECGGFIRGEGETVASAEQEALAKFQQIRVCDHRWARGSYRNGGTICKRCNGFRVTMRPVFTIGSIARKADDRDIEATILGRLELKAHHTPQDRRRMRMIWLRMRRAGVDIPTIPEEIKDAGYFETSPYTEVCRKIVAEAIDRGVLVPDLAPETGGIDGILNAMTSSSIKFLMREYHGKNPVDKA